MEISIVLPALNEEKSIGKTIKEIKEVLSKNKINFEIVVVDSNSEDKTAMIAKRLGAKVINEPIRGYGNALRRGFKKAKSDFTIMYDPDGSYDAKTLPLMIKTMKEGYNYVNANRFARMSPKAMSLKNYFGNKVINFMGNFFFGVKGKDMLSGFKGFDAKTLKRLNLMAKKWDLNVEIHSKIKSNNLKFKEIPTRYFARIGKSKLSGTAAAWNNFKYMLEHSSADKIMLAIAVVLFLIVIFLMALIWGLRLK